MATADASSSGPDEGTFGGDSDDEVDDFGGFASAPTAVDVREDLSKFGTAFEQAVEDTSWADFSGAPVTASPVVVAESRSLDSKLLHLEPLLADLQYLIDSAFAPSGQYDVYDPQPNDTLDAFFGRTSEDQPQSSGYESDCSRSSDLWKMLLRIEEAVSLHSRWVASETYTLFLDALKMNLELAKLHRCSLPLFACHLGESLMPEKCATPPTAAAKNTTGSQLSTATAAAMSAARRGDEDSATAPIPPTQFDWNRSGLVNPLNKTLDNSDTGLLDLEFFSLGSKAGRDTRGGGAGARSTPDEKTSLERELESLGLSNLQERKVDGAADSKRNIVDLLMKSGIRHVPDVIVRPPGQCSSDSPLSDEARRIVDKLPDLSFMSSPVLMFPLREQQQLPGQEPAEPF